MRKLYFGSIIILCICSGLLAYNISKIKTQNKVKTIKQEEINKKLEKEKQAKIEKKEILILATFIYENNIRVDAYTAYEYAEFIHKVCNHPSLVVAVITSETNFRPTCRSKIGAVGLGQIRPEMWFEELSKVFPDVFKEPKDLYNWRKNIIATDYILTKLLVRFDGDINKVLKYYVGGNHKKYIEAVKEDLVFLTRG